ncbi:hypothetical protein SAMN06265171_108182 [Chryseobacterium rhizoplanae]|uniref:Omptin family protein n=1 Tax=Chryseobacterium rhizoplanae TaxID=1609531 RepID=A0A521EKL4_9FLAO|nr:hypothetical protein [Chryseobacterium rhizoplanae]SMO84443.1 hypothetical protein SAMN06265171_108182 [Chryseobacterium rhizoplanae]
MRKTLGLLLILLSIQISAQTFTLEQLKGFNKLTMDEFKKEIKQQKFKFYDRTEGLGFLLTEYEAPDYTSKIGKFEYKEEKSEDRIEFEFKEKKEYDQYLKLVLADGYKATEKGKIITKEPYVDYYKDKEHIRLILPKTGESSPYTIIVFK